MNPQMNTLGMTPHQGFSAFLAYPFQGSVWMRQWLFYSLILTLLTLLFQPLASVIEMGFAFQVARQMLLQGGKPALPGRVPAQALFRDGLRWYLVSLLYNLPALIIVVAAGGWLIVHYGLPQRCAPWLGVSQGWPVLVMGLAQFLLSIPAAVLVVLPVFIGAVFSLYQRLVSIALYAGAYRQAIPPQS